MIVLLVAGIVLGVAGCLALGFGLPIKDTTFGNAILLAGIMLLCTAAVLLGLAMVARELRAISRGLNSAAGRATPRAMPVPNVRRPSPPTAPFAQPEESLEPDEPAPVVASVPGTTPPWAGEAASRRGVPPVVETPDIVEPPSEPASPERPPRRNLLFSSRRRDRAPSATDAGAMGPAELPPMAPPVLPPMPALEPTAFDSAWPARREAAEERTEASVKAVPPVNPLSPPRQPAGVTVIKSGVVDGMAYSLYSDGSIEAQMPEGMLRFASLDELRSHLESRP